MHNSNYVIRNPVPGTPSPGLPDTHGGLVMPSGSPLVLLTASRPLLQALIIGPHLHLTRAESCDVHFRITHSERWPPWDATYPGVELTTRPKVPDFMAL
jgi:hypothetical protein